MTGILRVLRDQEPTLWVEFRAVYVFGSALRAERPTDVDLLLVHTDHVEHTQVRREANKIVAVLTETLYGLDVHATIIGESEAEGAGILDLIEAKRIGGRKLGS